MDTATTMLQQNMYNHPSVSSAAMQPSMANTPYSTALRYPEPLAVIDNDPSVAHNPLYQSLRAQWEPILTQY